jgi:hypothetical protein
MKMSHLISEWLGDNYSVFNKGKFIMQKNQIIRFLNNAAMETH